jgi:uncharacterized protein
MPNVAVVTDSAATIPEPLLDALRFGCVPFHVYRGRQMLRDLVTVRRKAFYRWLPTARELPATASPGPGEYSRPTRHWPARRE